MKKVIAFILAIISATSLCLPAFAEDIDYSQMDFKDFITYSFKEYRTNPYYSGESKPKKSLLFYKAAKLSEKEAEKQADDICRKTYLIFWPLGSDGFQMSFFIESNFYIYNTKVFDKAIDKIYAKQERFFAAYGDEFESEDKFMTKEHIAGELYTHLWLYELIYRLTFISSINNLYISARAIDITPKNDIIPDSLIDAVGAIVLR